MYYALTNDQEIYLILCELVSDPYIAENILNFKNEIEKKDALEYHTNRWENICSKYFNALDTRYCKYSFILSDETFIIKKDHILDFYNETGISYQVVNLIHELIKKIMYYNYTISGIKIFPGNGIAVRFNDKLYSVLAKKIMLKMKN